MSDKKRRTKDWFDHLEARVKLLEEYLRDALVSIPEKQVRNSSVLSRAWIEVFRDAP